VTDVCDDCKRPVGKAPRRECAALLMGAMAIDHDDCDDATIQRLKSDLAALRATNERLEAECEAWRALAKEASGSAMSLEFQAAAIDLAQKLGLLPKQDAGK
jgi:hypothetical protein